MPKAKPTQVIVHRIELQEKEREMLETAVAAKAVRNLAEPAVAVFGAYVAYKSAKSLYGWTEDLADTFWQNTIIRKSNRERQRKEMEESGFVYGEQDWSMGDTFHYWTGGIFK